MADDIEPTTTNAAPQTPDPLDPSGSPTPAESTTRPASPSLHPCECSEALCCEIKKIQTQWYKCFIGWTAFHYILGLGATFISIILAVDPSSESDSQLVALIGDNKQLLSILNACMTAALTFLKAQEKSSAYIAAYRQLNVARIRYGDGQIGEKPLVDSYEAGEMIIQKSD